MMTVATVPTVMQIRVETGADLLDGKRPGWWKDIDLETLNLADGSVCVLGQLFGSYIAGVDEVIPGWDYDGVLERAEHGFTLGGLDIDWSSLTAEWVALIEKRREEMSV